MNSLVVSFFRFGSTVLAETMFAGLVADQLPSVTASGFGPNTISPASAVLLPFASIHGYRTPVVATGLISEATPPTPTWPKYRAKFARAIVLPEPLMSKVRPTRGEKSLNVTPGSAPGKLMAGSHGPPSGLASMLDASA